jgi:hypothetical protein
MKVKIPKSPFVTNITQVYKKLSLYQKSFAIAVLSSIVQTFIILNLIFTDPIVIYEKDGERLGYVGEKKSVVITQEEIKELVRKFIRSRYEWSDFNPNQIGKELAPFTKKRLIQKVVRSISKDKKQLIDKEVQQYVGKIKINIDQNNRIIGSFDKIIRIGKIPLLSEAQVLIEIVKGAITKTNKLGLYINSVVNYETK